MGYETKLYIGTVNTFGMKPYFMEIASIDLCKVAYNEMGELIEKTKKALDPETSKLSAIKNEVGDNSEVFLPILESSFIQLELAVPGKEDATPEDAYGDKLIAVPAEAVLYAMRMDNSKEPYRRFPPAIALLQSIIDNFGKEQIYCVLYGH